MVARFLATLLTTIAFELYLISNIPYTWGKKFNLVQFASSVWSTSLYQLMTSCKLEGNFINNKKVISEPVKTNWGKWPRKISSEKRPF